jgi:hypothetical protein
METERWMLTRRWGNGENEEMLVKSSVRRWISSGVLMYNKVAIINNNAFYTWNPLRNRSSVFLPHTHTHTHTHTNHFLIQIYVKYTFLSIFHLSCYFHCHVLCYASYQCVLLEIMDLVPSGQDLLNPKVIEIMNYIFFLWVKGIHLFIFKYSFWSFWYYLVCGMR